MKFLERLSRGPVFFDGAMGTQLIARGLVPGESSESWNISHPEAVQKVHEAYLQVGCQVLTTNTFGAHPLKWGGEKQKNLSGRPLPSPSGRNACGLIWAPTGRLLKPFGDLSFPEASHPTPVWCRPEGRSRPHPHRDPHRPLRSPGRRAGGKGAQYPSRSGHHVPGRKRYAADGERREGHDRRPGGAGGGCPGFQLRAGPRRAGALREGGLFLCYGAHPGQSQCRAAGFCERPGGIPAASRGIRRGHGCAVGVGGPGPGAAAAPPRSTFTA